jgi:hypothetical protein
MDGRWIASGEMEGAHLKHAAETGEFPGRRATEVCYAVTRWRTDVPPSGHCLDVGPEGARGMAFTRAWIAFVMVLALLALMPLTAFGLVNEYGMTFSGQSTCLGCHDPSLYAQTVHARMVNSGILPSAPTSWTVIRAAGDPPAVAGTMNNYWDSGGAYPIADPAEPWLTLGDSGHGLGTEYLIWKGSSNPSTIPWNLVEGFSWSPEFGWNFTPVDNPNTGLYDDTYNCFRCHMLGATNRTASASDIAAVPNPQVSIPATYTTGLGWARSSTTTLGAFDSSPAVSVEGMSVQCEACHGTGFKATPAVKHFTSGTELSNKMPATGTLPTTTVSTLGQSQVCGQCHGSYTNVAGTLGIYGYTPNLPMRLFVDVNGSSGGQSYTYVPTEAQFLANPTAYWLFPNGSNAKASHFYYNEWAVSGHSYRGALTSSSPDAMRFQAAGNGHFRASTSGTDCVTCHTGEGYEKSKDYQNTDPNVDIWSHFTQTTSTVGYMGQECVVCHSAHPSGTIGSDATDVVRAPDPAGVRSCFGLGTANSSICEDCHNWQYEVQRAAGNPGAGPSYRPGATSPSNGSGPIHPQRETLHGKVMLDVAPGAEFMPGAKCEDCHMPKTNKRANRYSHGMQIMLPGKADLWMSAATAYDAAHPGANGPSPYLGEDSCSRCHPGETRTQLQANIDTWQSGALAAAADASSAIVAAQTRAPAEYALTDPASPGYVLLSRATWNVKAFFSDASRGVHNPPYEMAALVVAKRMAQSVGGVYDYLTWPSTITSPTSRSYGFIVAHVRNGDGTSAGAAKIALEVNDGAGWSQLDSTSADANGNVSFLIAPKVYGAHRYRLRWDRCGDDRADKYSAVMTVTLAKIASRTTLKASTDEIRLGEKVTLSGAVSPSAAGRKVTLQRKVKSSGAWKNLWTLTLSSASKFSKSFKPTSVASWYFRVKYAGTSTVAASTSATVKVVVETGR